MGKKVVLVNIKTEGEKTIEQLKLNLLAVKDALSKYRTETKNHKHSQAELNKEIVKSSLKTKDYNNQLKALTKEEKLNKTIIDSERGSLNQLNALYSRGVLRLNAMSKSQRESTTAGKRLTASNAALKRKIDSVNASMGKHQGNVGNYKSALSGLGKNILTLGAQFLGVTAILTGAIRAIKTSIKIIIAFQKENSKLASILGTTRSKIKDLTIDAKKYGSTTAFTASEVTKLQIELAKLGFTTNQIKKSTKGILDLSAATGTDLAESATLAGSTLRAFGLRAKEMGRVTDVLAASTSKSALDMQKLKDSLSKVAPVAASAGVSLEETVAMLGELTNKGVDASTAGTGLRNVFLELSKQGLTFEEAMNKIKNASDKNKVSLDLFGKRGAVVGQILADTTEETKLFTAELKNAGGTAKRMADEQLDNVAGSVTKLKSALEGMILSLYSGNGSLQKIIENITSIISSFTKWRNLNVSSIVNAETDALSKEQTEINGLVTALTNADTPYKKRKKILDELIRIAPDVADGINAENVEYKKINLQLDAYNDKTLKTIILKRLEKEETKALMQYSKLILKNAKNQSYFNEKIGDGVKLLKKQGIEIDLEGKTQEEKAKLLKSRLAGFEKFGAGSWVDVKTGKVHRQLSDEWKMIKSLTTWQQDVTKSQNELSTSSAKKEADRYKKRIENLKEILGLTEEISEIPEKPEKPEKPEIPEAPKTSEIQPMTAVEAKQLEIEGIAIENEKLIINEEKTNNKITELKKRVAASSIEIKKAETRQAIAMNANLIGQAAALFKKNTVAHKLFASAQATMNTYLGASKALATLPAPYSFIQSALVIAAGLKNVAEINKVKFSRGTILQGNSHANNGIQLFGKNGEYYGEGEGGEAIINKNSTRMFPEELSRINIAGGGRPLTNSSGFYAEGGSLAEREMMYQPVLVVQDVNDLNDIQTKIDVMQTF